MIVWKLRETDKELESEMIQRMISEIMSITNVKMDTNYGPLQRQSSFVFFYKIDESYKPIAIDLFENGAITETHIREQSTLSNFMSNRRWVTAETDGFDLIDVKATNLDYIFKVLEYDFSLDIDGFVNEYKRANIYE